MKLIKILRDELIHHFSWCLGEYADFSGTSLVKENKEPPQRNAWDCTQHWIVPVLCLKLVVLEGNGDY